MDLQPLDDLLMAETPEDYEQIKGCLNDKYYDMIQRIIKDPKAKDNMLLKLLKQNSYATSKSIANKITKEKEREFIREYKVSKSIAKAKEASRRVEQVIKEENQTNYPDLDTNPSLNPYPSESVGQLDEKQLKAKINGKHGSDMILE